MRSKWILLILIVAISVMLSGCTDEKKDKDVQGQTEILKEGDAVVQVDSEKFLVTMEYYGFTPAELNIDVGDIITWKNNNRQKVYTLSSVDGLFKEQVMKYGNMTSHTFTKGGTYTFSIKDTDMTMKVHVK